MKSTINFEYSLHFHIVQFEHLDIVLEALFCIAGLRYHWVLVGNFVWVPVGNFAWVLGYIPVWVLVDNLELVVGVNHMWQVGVGVLNHMWQVGVNYMWQVVVGVNYMWQAVVGVHHMLQAVILIIII